MARAPQPSYAWSLLRDEDWAQENLSKNGREGFRWAQMMGERTARWSKKRGGPESFRTIDELAAHEDQKRRRRVLPPGWQGPASITPQLVRKRIAEARREAFGELSDSGAYRQIRHEAELRLRKGPGTCAAADCENELPWDATTRRDFCSGRCRRRDWYHRTKNKEAWIGAPGDLPAVDER